MANEFNIKNGFISNGNGSVNGSLSATTYYGDGSNLSGVGLPYLVYTALITQSSTSAPMVTELENTLGSINVNRSTTGVYTISSTALFTSNTTIQINSYSRISTDPTTNYFARSYRSSPNTIYIETFKFETTPATQFTATDDALENTFFEIRVYN